MRIFKLTITLLTILYTQTSYAEPRIYSDNKFDVGIALSPSFTPQSTYEQTTVTFGIEIGYSLVRYEDKALVDPEPTVKFLRFGVGLLGNNTPVAIFTPLSVKFRNKIYLNPSLGFGRRPHSILSLTYEIQ